MSLERATLVPAVRDLAVEATALSVLQGLREDGVRALLLKGPVLRRWLYDDAVRGSLDVDVLVAPDDLASAGRSLQRLGFQRRWPVDGLNREIDADTWIAKTGGVPVELHRTIAGVGAGPERLWEAVSRDTTALELSGGQVEAFGLPARAMHVALHAAQHGSGWEQPTQDLERALSRVQLATWRQAAALAARIEATDAFAAGLRILPAGRDLADRLGLPERFSTHTLLRLEGAPSLALGVDRFAATPGARAKAAFLARKFLPEPAFMRAWSPLARAGRLGLAAAYLWRPLYLLTSAPGTLWRWGRARRNAGRRTAGARP